MSGSVSDSPYQFTGQQNDGTGLYYYRARYYNPGWGRFITEDPIGPHGGLNPYSYAMGNPAQLRDPTGNGPAGAVIGGLIGGLIAAGGSEGAGTFWGAYNGAVIGSDIEDLLGELANGFGCFLANESGGGKFPHVPELDRSGRVHGEIPSYVPENWTREQQEDLQRDLETSLRNRQLDQLRFGEDPGHRERMRIEQILLRQILKRLTRL
jgi:RHS repeat-associated protein